MMLYKLIIHTHESEASALHVTHVSAQCLPRRDEFVLFELDGATILARVFDVVHDVAPQRNPDEVQCPVTIEVIVHARIGDPVDWRERALAAETKLAAIREAASEAADACAQAIKRDTLASLISVAMRANGALDRIVLLCDGDASPIPAPHVVEAFEQMKRADDARALLRANGWVESEPGEWSPATSETWAIKIHAVAYTDERVDELVGLYPDLDQAYDSFRPAARALVEFLVEELGAHDWPLAVLCPDGADVQDGKPVVDAWAFAVLPFDTTSYIRPDGVLTWLGTSWEPGCECGEALEDGSDPWPQDHRDGCPVCASDCTGDDP